MKINFPILLFFFTFGIFHLHAQKDTIPYSSYADDGTFISLNHGDFVSRVTISAGGEVNYFRQAGIGANVGLSFFQPGKFYLQGDWMPLNSTNFGVFSAKGMYFLYGKEDSVHRQVVTGVIHNYYNRSKKRDVFSRADVINKFYAGLHGGISASYTSHNFPYQTELSFGGGILMNKHYEVFYSHIDQRLAQRERSHKCALYADACYYPQTSLDERVGRFFGYRVYFDVTQSFYCKYDLGANLKLGWEFDGYEMGPIVGMSLYGGF